MDIRFNSRFWLLFQTVITIISLVEARECRVCKPGYYASRLCTELHDTVCKPCSIGSFSHIDNVFKECLSCSKCGVGQFVLKKCSKRSDTECELCSSVTDTKSVTESYIRDCLHYQKDEPGQSPDYYDNDGVKIHHGLHGDSSLTSDLANVIYEGSGETVLVDTTEGSGVIPVIDETEKNITDVILPDETYSTFAEKTTRLHGIIYGEDGIKLQNDTDTHKTDVILIVPTTPRTLLLNKNKGVGLTDPNEAPVDEVDVFVEELQEESNPRTGASKHEQQQSGGTSVGVVVTVGLLSALVFFILGFLASKFYNGRRERTFNVMEAERLNGKPPVEVSGIEYKPSDRNKGSVYDEIPARRSKLNGNGTTGDARSHDPESGADPVYSKPIKREHAQPSSSAPPTEDNGPRKEQPNTETRPESEIRYMDETEDQETDRLLPTSGAVNDVNTSASSSASAQSDNQNGKGSPDEKTPMLSQESGHS